MRVALDGQYSNTGTILSHVWRHVLSFAELRSQISLTTTFHISWQIVCLSWLHCHDSQACGYKRAVLHQSTGTLQVFEDFVWIGIDSAVACNVSPHYLCDTLQSLTLVSIYYRHKA